MESLFKSNSFVKFNSMIQILELYLEIFLDFYILIGKVRMFEKHLTE